ncbi:Invasion protein IbeA [Balamuthia mandrillaris]
MEQSGGGWQETHDPALAKKLEERARGQVLRWAGVKSAGRRAAAKEAEHVERRTDAAVAAARVKKLADHLGAIAVVEPQKTLPVLAECDVLVVGGGPSGLAAAIGAARAGADTILMERYGCFGGCITTVGMETLAWYRYEGTTDVEGVGIEMERLAAQMGGTVKFAYNDSHCLDADFFKIVADRMVRENGIRPLLHTMAVEVVKDEYGDVAGVVTESKSGRMVVQAKRVVDCTGDADVAFLAGAPYTKYEPEHMMSVTTVFNASNIDKQCFLEYTERNPATYKDWSREWEQETTGKEDALRSPYLDLEFVKAQEAGVMPSDAEQKKENVWIGGTWSSLTNAGEATNLNLVHMSQVDATNVLELTRAEMEGRRQVMHALAALRHTVPGFEKAKLRNMGMTLGVRDTRKIDVKGQARFDDSIGIFPEFIDGYNVLILPTTGRYFHVPLGCLVPKGVDNLLVAGRCVAGDRVSHAATRNMMCCTVTGQGAGVAAAVSIKAGTTTSNVDIGEVQKELLRQGVRIH